MAEGNSRANAALVVSTSAAVAAAMAWLGRQPQGVAAESFPPEAMELLAAIASGVDRLSEQLGQISIPEGETRFAVQGWPPNQSGFMVTRRWVRALGQWYQFPDIPVPDGYLVLIKAWPTNAGLVYVGASRSEVTNLETVYPLLPNEFVRLQLQNFDQVYVSGLAAGGSFVNDSAVAIVEFPRGKGG